MESFFINISLPIFVSFVFSTLIFYYLYSFKDKEPHLKIYTHLFLTFVFSGIFLIFNKNNILIEDFFLFFSFILFLSFIFFTYKKYGTNLDIFNFILIGFYFCNFIFYYLIFNYSIVFENLSETFILNYIIILILIALIFFHKRKNSNNNLVFYSYLVLVFYQLIHIFYQGPFDYWMELSSIFVFFLLHLIHAKEQVYSPLIKRLEILKIQSNRQNAKLPEHIRRQFQIMEHNKAKLMDMAYTDKMTGVLNKDRITSTINDLIKDKRVNVFSIMMFDIDDFKQINDTMGHLVGDECLINLAKISNESIRKNDFLGRYGGDEFITILSGLDAYETKVIAERFRLKISRETEPKFTVSIGVSSYPEDGITFKELILNADKALYISKEKGKNKVSHAKLY